MGSGRVPCKPVHLPAFPQAPSGHCGVTLHMGYTPMALFMRMLDEDPQRGFLLSVTSVVI